MDTDAVLIDVEVKLDLDIGVGDSRYREEDASCADMRCAARKIDSRDMMETAIVKETGTNDRPRAQGRMSESWYFLLSARQEVVGR